MKKLLGLFTIYCLILAANCNKEGAEDDIIPVIKEGELSINFKGEFDRDPLLMYAQAYPYQGDMSLKFQLFQFYLSDIYLLTAAHPDSLGPKLSDVELISFKDIQSEADAQEGVSISIEGIPVGNYKGLRFGVGVSPELNKTTPGNYTPPHPLDDHYWSAALGYVFTKIEGNADLNGDGVFTEKLTFHSGRDKFYKEKSLFTDISVAEDGNNLVLLKIDLMQVISRSVSDFLDFREVTQDHGNNEEIVAYIMDNLSTAISVK